MKVYLAAPYTMKDTIKTRANELRLYGIEVTSRWIDEPHGATTQLREISHEDLQKYALADVQDVVDADIMVFHTDTTKTLVRSGRHVEFGIAITLGLTRAMPILVVGVEQENIFHYLHNVTHYESWTQVKEALVAIHTRTGF